VSVTDELPADNAAYAENFSGPLPLPPAKHFVFDVATGKLTVVRRPFTRVPDPGPP
jgi:hypothetical protein